MVKSQNQQKISNKKEKIYRMYANFTELESASMECQEKTVTKGGTFVHMSILKFAKNTKCLKTQKRDVKAMIATKCM